MRSLLVSTVTVLLISSPLFGQQGTVGPDPEVDAVYASLQRIKTLSNEKRIPVTSIALAVGPGTALFVKYESLLPNGDEVWHLEELKRYYRMFEDTNAELSEQMIVIDGPTKRPSGETIEEVYRGLKTGETRNLWVRWQTPAQLPNPDASAYWLELELTRKANLVDPPPETPSSVRVEILRMFRLEGGDDGTSPLRPAAVAAYKTGDPGSFFAEVTRGGKTFVLNPNSMEAAELFNEKWLIQYEFDGNPSLERLDISMQKIPEMFNQVAVRSGFRNVRILQLLEELKNVSSERVFLGLILLGVAWEISDIFNTDEPDPALFTSTNARISSLVAQVDPAGRNENLVRARIQKELDGSGRDEFLRNVTLTEMVCAGHLEETR